MIFLIHHGGPCKKIIVPRVTWLAKIKFNILMTAWWRNFLYSINRLHFSVIWSIIGPDQFFGSDQFLSSQDFHFLRTGPNCWTDSNQTIFGPVWSGFSILGNFVLLHGPKFVTWSMPHGPDQVKFRTKFLTSDLTRLKSGPKSVSQTRLTYLGPKIGTTEFRTSLVFRSGHVQDRFHSRPFTLGQKIHFNLFGPNTISGSVGHVTAIINHNGR